MGGALPQARPDPAYIAQSAAEQLTSTELDRAVIVSHSALNLVNGFLDQVLFNILSLSRATTVDALRQVVPRLLRPRLGHAAISAADEELRDYVREEDPENLQQPPRLAKPSDFDLELAWKLARLRCMVYARLGDMEEEDEEEYLESERLEEHAHGSPMSVVPMSAIFLTSVLEFLGEQALCNAAQHAEKRHNARITETASSSQDVHPEDEEVILDQQDMLQLGREGPLSRLWRSWRRDSRVVEPLSSRSMTPGTAMSPTFTDTSHSRNVSHASPTHVIPEEDSPKSRSLTPSQIPLPLREADVDEIEVPGLAPEFDASDRVKAHRPALGLKRPSSLRIVPGDFPSSPEDETSTSPTIPTRSPLRPSYARQRSQSLPTSSEKLINTFERPSKRDTMASTGTWQTETVGDLTDDTENEASAREQYGSTSARDSRPSTQHSHRGAGAINGAAVAAIAGALGIEAARSRQNRDRHQGVRPVTPPAQTAAPAYSQPSRDGTLGGPEGLALSSADERFAAHPRELRDSGFGTSGSRTSVIVPASPASPRRNREAAVYENSIVSSPQEPSAEFGGEIRPNTRESVTFEPSALAHVSAQDANIRDSTNTDLVFQRPDESESDSMAQSGAWTTSIPPRMSSREQPQHGPTLSKSSQYSHNSKNSSTSSKLLGFSRDQNGRPLKEQRAGFNDPDQASHSRQGSAATQKVIAASPESNLASRREHLRVRADSEDDAARTRSLEILIKSDETLHYTLTPASARAEEVRTDKWNSSREVVADILQFPHSPEKPKTETQDLADFFRNTAPPGEPQPSGHSRSAKQSLNGLRSNPPDSYQQGVTTGTSRADRTHPAELSAMPNSPRKAAQQPRDPRPERNTTRDLADYVRSTGPTNETQYPQAVDPAVGEPTKRVSPMPATVPNQSSPQSSTSRPENRLKFQARDARPQPGTETAELIDFIRRGPQLPAGEHRIDRKVAPFRTTMDSDDLQALAPPSELPGRDSVGSTLDSTATKSMQESTNSHTALLESSRQNNYRSVAPPISHDIKRQVIPEQDGMPQRTRRRVKDPYAIDVSDDEDETEQIAAQVKTRNEEESLIDFLRNTAPPPGMGTKPIIAATPSPQDKANLKRSVSNSKLRDILSRDGSTKNGINVSTNGARDAPGPTRQTSTVRQAAPVNNKPKQKFQPREAKNNVSSTGDLAKFLMESGPPADSNPSPLPNPDRQGRMVRSDVKEQAGFMKFFTRKASVRR